MVALTALLFCLGVVRTAVAAVETDRGDVTDNDPLEPVNRVIFELNRRIFRYVARPIAKTYRKVVPRPIRDGFRNGLDNLGSPLLFGNQVLQGDAGAATRTLARFFLNSTVGIGGTIDIGSRLGIASRDADLGQTFGVWGIGPGPYLVLPLLGPSTSRDAVGTFAQGSADPFNLWIRNADLDFLAFLIRFVLGNLDTYARRMNELDAIEATSVDFYASLRSLYLQKQQADIQRVRRASLAASTDLDYDLELDEEDLGSSEEPEPNDSSSP